MWAWISANEGATSPTPSATLMVLLWMVAFMWWAICHTETQIALRELEEWLAPLREAPLPTPADVATSLGTGRPSC